jgi:acetyltransferase
VIVLDARIAVAPFAGRSRLAIRPYPKEWERRLRLRDGSSVLARPVRPEDEEVVRSFLGKVEPEDLRLRFFAPVKDFGHPFIARLTQLDYARAIAFLAVEEASGAVLGVVRLHADANHETAEFAILVRSDLKGRGLGWQLMQLMIEYARADGLRIIHGQVLRENATMIAMCKELGFEVTSLADPADALLVRLALVEGPG